MGEGRREKTGQRGVDDSLALSDCCRDARGDGSGGWGLARWSARRLLYAEEVERAVRRGQEVLDEFAAEMGAGASRPVNPSPDVFANCVPRDDMTAARAAL